MNKNKAGASLDSLMSSFNARITQLQEIVIARNNLMAVSAMELQVKAIKDRLREEAQAIPKTKKLIDALLQQQNKLQNMSLHVPYQMADKVTVSHLETSRCLFPEFSGHDSGSFEALKLDEEPAAVPKRLQETLSSQFSSSLDNVKNEGEETLETNGHSEPSKE